MRLSSIEIKQFQKKILLWYQLNKRSLPWRGIPGGIPLGERAYRILVSEVMLQQTQVSRVIPKYEAWFAKFPTIHALADAPVSEVLRLWSGLGYNRRALHLQKAARLIHELSMRNQALGVKKDDTYWPNTIDALKRLPGVGEYTARAVLCFAFNKQIAVVDTNVRKVILVEVLKGKKEIEGTRGIQEIADRLLPKGKARDWNQALMDYASVVLKKEKISVPKQSRFVGSNRYYRGKLLRLLLAERALSLEEVGVKLKKDFSQNEHAWLHALISQMENDGFVCTDKTNIYLRS